MKFAQRIKD